MISILSANSTKWSNTLKQFVDNLQQTELEPFLIMWWAVFLHHYDHVDLLYHRYMLAALFSVSDFHSLKEHIFQQTPFSGCFQMEPMRYGKQYLGI